MAFTILVTQFNVACGIIGLLALFVAALIALCLTWAEDMTDQPKPQKRRRKKRVKRRAREPLNPISEEDETSSCTTESSVDCGALEWLEPSCSHVQIETESDPNFEMNDCEINWSETGKIETALANILQQEDSLQSSNETEEFALIESRLMAQESGESNPKQVSFCDIEEIIIFDQENNETSPVLLQEHPLEGFELISRAMAFKPVAISTNFSFDITLNDNVNEDQIRRRKSRIPIPITRKITPTKPAQTEDVFTRLSRPKSWSKYNHYLSTIIIPPAVR